MPGAIKKCMHGVRKGAIPRLEGPYWQNDGFHPNTKAQPLICNALVRALVAKAGKHVALLVQRDEARLFVPVPLG